MVPAPSTRQIRALHRVSDTCHVTDRLDTVRLSGVVATSGEPMVEGLPYWK